MIEIIAMAMILTGILAIVNIIRSDATAWTYSIGFVLCSVLLVLLKKTKNYILPALIGMVALYSLNIFNLFIYSHFYHFVDYLWIIFQILFVFFLLKERVGMINFFVNIISIAILYYYKNEIGYHEIQSPYSSWLFLNFTINLLIIAFLIAYLIHQMLSQMKTSNNRILDATTEIAKQNEEKTVMLKEIHHRVKNNLQVISSLLRLQTAEVDDKETLHHFEDAVNRVSAMAMIHEKMYQTDSLAKIDLKNYFNELAHNLIKSYAPNKKIDLTIKSEVLGVQTKSLVPIALIFNELISNSLEHAFAGKETGKIEIRAKFENETLFLEYCDNGEWKTPIKTKSFGLELIETFTEQLEGTYERSTDEGNKYLFEFKIV